jgi:hypothetical protein
MGRRLRERAEHANTKRSAGYSVAQRSEALGVFIIHSVSPTRTGFSIFSYPSEEVYTFLPHVASTIGAGDQPSGRRG